MIVEFKISGDALSQEALPTNSHSHNKSPLHPYKHIQTATTYSHTVFLSSSFTTVLPLLAGAEVYLPPDNVGN